METSISSSQSSAPAQQHPDDPQPTAELQVSNAHANAQGNHQANAPSDPLVAVVLGLSEEERLHIARVMERDLALQREEQQRVMVHQLTLNAYSLDVIEKQKKAVKSKNKNGITVQMRSTGSTASANTSTLGSTPSSSTAQNYGNYYGCNVETVPSYSANLNPTVYLERRCKLCTAKLGYLKTTGTICIDCKQRVCYGCSRFLHRAGTIRVSGGRQPSTRTRLNRAKRAAKEGSGNCRICKLCNLKREHTAISGQWLQLHQQQRRGSSTTPETPGTGNTGGVASCDGGEVAGTPSQQLLTSIKKCTPTAKLLAVDKQKYTRRKSIADALRIPKNIQTLGGRRPSESCLSVFNSPNSSRNTSPRASLTPHAEDSTQLRGVQKYFRRPSWQAMSNKEDAGANLLQVGNTPKPGGSEPPQRRKSWVGQLLTGKSGVNSLSPPGPEPGDNETTDNETNDKEKDKKDHKRRSSWNPLARTKKANSSRNLLGTNDNQGQQQSDKKRPSLVSLFRIKKRKSDTYVIAKDDMIEAENDNNLLMSANHFSKMGDLSKPSNDPAERKLSALTPNSSDDETRRKSMNEDIDKAMAALEELDFEYRTLKYDEVPQGDEVKLLNAMNSSPVSSMHLERTSTTPVITLNSVVAGGSQKAVPRSASVLTGQTGRSVCTNNSGETVILDAGSHIPIVITNSDSENEDDQNVSTSGSNEKMEHSFKVPQISIQNNSSQGNGKCMSMRNIPQIAILPSNDSIDDDTAVMGTAADTDDELEIGVDTIVAQKSDQDIVVIHKKGSLRSNASSRRHKGVSQSRSFTKLYKNMQAKQSRHSVAADTSDDSDVEDN